MSSLKAKQVLVKVSKLTQRKEEKINKREIEKKINQIKYLSGKKKISKVTLKKQINSLEKQLKGVLLLEKKLKTKKMQLYSRSIIISNFKLNKTCNNLRQLILTSD